VFVAGVLGGTEGKLQVVEVGLGRVGNGERSTVAYAIYHDGDLAQVVVPDEELDKRVWDGAAEAQYHA